MVILKLKNFLFNCWEIHQQMVSLLDGYDLHKSWQRMDFAGGGEPPPEVFSFSTPLLSVLLQLKMLDCFVDDLQSSLILEVQLVLKELHINKKS